MTALKTWVAGRKKTVASTLVVALFVGVPLTVAALHPGFPVTDVDLTARDVWVTNGDQLLGGRLNRQIEELNGSVVASSSDFDVLQDGDSLFMVDPAAGRVESVSASTTEVTSSIDVPTGAEVRFGGGVISIVSPSGDLWTVSAAGDLVFNYAQSEPLVKLGDGGSAVVTESGAVIAVAPSEKAAYRIETLGAEVITTDFPAIGEFELTAVGERAVALDTTTSTIVTEDGTAHELSGDGLRLQQVGAENDAVYVATGDSLLAVDLGSGEVTETPANIERPATSPADVSAPVFLDGCVHGAWAGAGRYLFACGDDDPQAQDIEEPTQGSVLEFRVNRSVIALNNLTNGNAWVLGENMRLVDNWEDVTPPEEAEGEEGDEKSATQSLADTLAERTETNRPPIAADDLFGVRPGKTTIIPVLDNDSDPDGDVLVVVDHDSVAETTGKLDYIDGGRALQFTPAPGFVGGFVFGYTVQDGRGGSATARVNVNVRPTDLNEPPTSQRLSATTTEVDQTVSYNVLNDWLDPDGDDLYLVGASPKSGDLVRFTPDGFITFSHRTSEIGIKEIAFQVSDGIGAPVAGVLTVDVQPSGSLNPIGTPDFATTFSGESVVVEPLLNDLSPSGAPISLAGLTEAGGGSSALLNGDQGTIAFSAPGAGVYYVTYTLEAAGKTSTGIVRFDVVDKPSAENPPVAVKDTAYLRGDAPTTVSVLSNDVSPSGRILAVQSIDVDPALTAKGLVVELLESTLVRVTSPQALTEQVSFTYTISDGLNTATAGVTVVPVPPLTKHQPPVAIDDNVKVRAGDIVTVDVLENDFHPDDATMTVAEKLVTEPSTGLAFVNDNTVRFQAPTEPGEYRLGYQIVDQYRETGAASVVFTVTAPDEAGNQDPVPEPLVARVLAGGSIRVNVPLGGVDPDGDSVQLLGFPSNPTLGSVVEEGIDYFVYESAVGLAGTDEFSYEVYDAYGATGVASVKIAVIPEPTESLPPNAVPDSVLIRPGKTAQVDVTANDSDPQGALIKVSPDLIDVPDGISAEVAKKQFLILEAPDKEMSFSLRYELTNDLGGSAVSYVQVQVTPDAPLLPPTAKDIVIPIADIAGQESVTVDVFDSAFNPSGRTEELEVSLDGPNASSGTLNAAGGRVEVTPTTSRQAIAYRVTNAEDGLDAMAFILVPAAAGDEFDDPPIIDPSLPPQIISENETKEWDLDDIVFVPSGRDVIITAESTVSGVQGNGDRIYVDKDTLRFTPARDYRGPAAINFTVTDGSSPKDPKGNVATLRLNITVGDPEFRDTEPTFTAPSVNVEVGEQTVIDLRASTAHPNPQILQQVSYSAITGATAGVAAQLNGSELTVSTPRTTRKGTIVTLGVTLRWDKFEVPGTINVTVVSSTRPLAVAVADTLEAKRGAGASVIPVLANDSNPFASTGEPLTLLSATVENTGQPANVSVEGNNLRITPNPNLKSGQIDVTYRIQDATQDPDREVNGTATLIVSDVPDQVAKPARQPNSDVGGDRTATFVFAAPASNGKPISSYEIRSSPAVGLPACTAGAPCTLTGLNNGTAYTLSARAINVHGAGEWSDFSEPVTPYGTPANVGTPTVQSQSTWAPATITWQWPAVAATGGSTTYEWVASNGASGQTGGTTASISGVPAGSYTITVTARNSGGKSSQSGSTSNPTTVQNQPVPTAAGTPSGSASGFAPATITWNWSGVADTGGLAYVVKMSNGQSKTVTGTSASFTSLPAGTYTATVTTRNNAGAGPESGRSAPVGVANPPVVPPPDVKNPRIAVASGAAVNNANCGSASCAYVAFNAYELAPNTTFEFCNSVASSRITRTTNGNGDASGQFTAYFGYPDQNVTVSVCGARSDTRLWKNAERLR